MENRRRDLVIPTLDIAARNASAQGHHREAQGIYQRVVELTAVRHGTDSVEYAQVLEELAAAFEQSNNWGLAEPLYSQAVAIYRQQLGQAHTRVALALRNLAEACRRQGRELEAKRFEAEAAKILSARLNQARQ